MTTPLSRSSRVQQALYSMPSSRDKSVPSDARARNASAPVSTSLPATGSFVALPPKRVDDSTRDIRFGIVGEIFHAAVRPLMPPPTMATLPGSPHDHELQGGRVR